MMAFITPLVVQTASHVSSFNRPPHKTPPTPFIAPHRRTAASTAQQGSRPSRPITRVMTPVASVSVGSSALPSTEQAVNAALDCALSATPSPTVALVTHTVHRNAHEVHRLIRHRLPTVRIHGATTCNAFLSNTGVIPNGVGIMLHDSQQMSTASSTLDNCDVTEAVNRVVTQLKADLKHVHSILMSASPGIEEQVLNVFSELLPAVKVFGGSAADNTVSGEWKLLSDGGVFSQGLSVVGMTSNVAFGSSLVPPYEKGPQHATVTKCEGRIIHELDGKQAGQVLRDWVGESIHTQATKGGAVLVECASFPLGIERVSGGWIGIHAAEITAQGSVALFAEVKQGDKLTVMRNMGASDSATAAGIGLRRAYKQALIEGGFTQAKAGVVIYCGGLGIAVGDRLDDSLEPIKGAVDVLGMTAFGEQGSVAGCNVHSNLAVGVALFG